MRTQYYYQPPNNTPNWLSNLRHLIEPPMAYVTFLAGMVLAIYLSLSGSEYGPRILILLLAFPIHEFAHAIVADRLGDPTPRNHGRITLNPFAQLDLLGSVLILAFGLGWAYVPIQPSYLRPNPRVGHMLVALAGPVANLILAFITAILWFILSPALLTLGASQASNLFFMFYYFSFINIALFFFNLIPLAPLDGLFILKGLLPDELAYRLEQVQQYSMLIFGVLFLLPFLTGISILGPFIFEPAQMLTNLMYLRF